MLVPLRLKYGLYAVGTVPETRYDELVEYIVPQGSDSDTVPTPGATRSGLADQSRYVGPRELKVAMLSSPRPGVPFVLEAPTVSTHGALPGATMPPYCGSPLAFFPRLPAAATTTTPASTTRLAASVSGSVRYDSVTDAPTERFTTRIL